MILKIRDPRIEAQLLTQAYLELASKPAGKIVQSAGPRIASQALADWFREQYRLRCSGMAQLGLGFVCLYCEDVRLPGPDGYPEPPDLPALSRIYYDARLDRALGLCGNCAAQPEGLDARKLIESLISRPGTRLHNRRKSCDGVVIDSKGAIQVAPISPGRPPEKWLLSDVSLVEDWGPWMIEETRHYFELATKQDRRHHHANRGRDSTQDGGAGIKKGLLLTAEQKWRLREALKETTRTLGEFES